jgi:hypothetical protein
MFINIYILRLFDISAVIRLFIYLYITYMPKTMLKLLQRRIETRSKLRDIMIIHKRSTISGEYFRMEALQTLRKVAIISYYVLT